MSVADARADLAELRSASREGLLGRRLRELPDGHPSSPRYGDRVRPATDAEHAEHVADVRHRLAGAREAGLATHFRHTIDPAHEVWSRARRAAHDQILGEMYAAASAVPCERRAVLAGGLPGAGKTTVLSQHAGLDGGRNLTINPDDMKQQLASRGLIPAVSGLTPMEAAGLAHEEASHLAKRLARIAQAAGKNVIWDVTLAKPDSAGKRIEALRTGGYQRVDGLFVDVPAAVSMRRADLRHRAGHDEFLAGRGCGGRYVPADMIDAQADGDRTSHNRRHFAQVADRFDAWWIYDNSADGRPPLLIAHGARPSRAPWEAE